MKLEIGQHVKCFMRTSTIIEGTVEEFTENQLVLKSLDKKSLLIIHRPAEDIMLTKVILEEEVEESPEKIANSITSLQQNVRAKLHEVQNQTSEDVELQRKNLMELRKMVLEQERKIVSQKRREHFGSPYAPEKMGNYTNPSLGKSAYVPGKLQKR